MKLNWRVLAGVLLVVVGVLAMLQTTNIIKFEGGIWLWLFAGIIGLVGIGFLSVLIKEPAKNWWAAIPGLSLLGLGALMVVESLPWNTGDLPPAIFMGCIGLSFVIVYLLNRARWWAIIPAGSLLSVAGMILLPEMGGWTASILFFGLAVTFGVVALVGQNKMNWAWIPAAALLALGVFVPSVEGSMPWIIWPLALIVVGVYLIGRSMLKK